MQARAASPHQQQTSAASAFGTTAQRGATGDSLSKADPHSVGRATSDRSSAEGGAPGTPAREFHILGVLGKLYVLMENADGLVLVDQHAAHERILFEEMRRRMEQQGVPAQRLLMPLTLEVTPRDADWLSQHLTLLERAGINLEPFGAATFKIDSLPTFLRASDPSQLLRDIIDELRETVSQDSRLRLGEEMIAKTVCRHAVKANDYLREPELVRLVQDLLACDLPYCCPHGRPTMIQISYLELEKKFGRKA
jgi:DNA mismatch repair protein MutL